MHFERSGGEAAASLGGKKLVSRKVHFRCFHCKQASEFRVLNSMSLRLYMTAWMTSFQRRFHQLWKTYFYLSSIIEYYLDSFCSIWWCIFTLLNLILHQKSWFLGVIHQHVYSSRHPVNSGGHQNRPCRVIKISVVLKHRLQNTQNSACPLRLNICT